MNDVRVNKRTKEKSMNRVDELVKKMRRVLPKMRRIVWIIMRNRVKMKKMCVDEQMSMDKWDEFWWKKFMWWYLLM